MYGDSEGKWVKEDSPLAATTPNATTLIQTEKEYLLLQERGWQVLLFRLGEIYGPGRTLEQKIARLQGRTLSGNGSSFTNMIHLEDIVGAIDYSVEHELTGIFNLCDDEQHLTREEFYQQLAAHYNCPHVVFDNSSRGVRSGSKRVSNQKIKQTGYVRRRPTRLTS